MTEQFKGSIHVISPDHEELEEPSFEWIARFHKTFFAKLSKLQNIQAIIGLLPGTTKTAADLKTDLNCELILLATAKIGTERQDLKEEINNLSKNADKIWSIGTDLFTHFNSIFQESSSKLSEQHRQITLIPDTELSESTVSAQDSPGIRKMVSVWSPGIPFIHKGRKERLHGSSQQNFETASAALAKINETNLYNHESIVEWHVHGLKKYESTTKSIGSQAIGDLEQLVALQKPGSLDDIKLSHCLAFVVPDKSEDTFYYAALSAMWQGIPTLVSSQSSIGKWLLELQCPEIGKSIVALTGDSQIDKETWIKKFDKDILDKDSNPGEWAAKIKEFLPEMPSTLNTVNAKKDEENDVVRKEAQTTSEDISSKVNCGKMQLPY